MTRLFEVLSGLAMGSAVLLTAPLAQAEFPEKSIEFIIPFGAGGGADIEGRLLAEELSKILGVSVVPVNKPGAGGAVTYSYVKDAAPDGYTIAWNSTSILTTTNIGNVPFEHDAMDHIGRVEYQPMSFAVHADAPWADLEAFLAACQANPNSLKVANSGTGSATHLGALSMMTAAACEVVHLPVGIKRRNATVLSGEADAMVAPLTGSIRLAKAGKIRLLASLGSERNGAIPDVPTAMELGLDAQLDLFRGLSVPANTPEDVKERLANAMVKAARSEAFMKLAGEVGFTVAPLTVAEFETLLETEDAKVKAIMRAADLYQSKAVKN